MTMTGHCLCGQFSYETSSDPVVTAVCHCKNCQRQAGSAFSIIVAVPSASLTTHGTLKTYADNADSGAVVSRQFCPDCGSPIFSLVPGSPGMTFIKAGTLDDTEALKPQVEVWIKSAQPWARLTGLPAFDTVPPGA